MPDTVVGTLPHRPTTARPGPPPTTSWSGPSPGRPPRRPAGGPLALSLTDRRRKWIATSETTRTGLAAAPVRLPRRRDGVRGSGRNCVSLARGLSVGLSPPTGRGQLAQFPPEVPGNGRSPKRGAQPVPKSVARRILKALYGERRRKESRARAHKSGRGRGRLHSLHCRSRRGRTPPAGSPTSDWPAGRLSWRRSPAEHSEPEHNEEWAGEERPDQVPALIDTVEQLPHPAHNQSRAEENEKNRSRDPDGASHVNSAVSVVSPSGRAGGKPSAEQFVAQGGEQDQQGDEYHRE